MPLIKILIINPNTSQSMTDALRAPIESLDYNNTTYTYLTSPSSPPGGIPSINSTSDAALSTPHTLPAILPHLPTHDAFLVACYSPHPLVEAVKGELAGGGGGDGGGGGGEGGDTGVTRKNKHKPVMGIFEASVWSAVQLLNEGEGERFGIVSTGDVWRGVLRDAIVGAGDYMAHSILGQEKASHLFAGVETCGLDAGDLHTSNEVAARVKDAAKRLMGKGKVAVVVLGCAGMVGMEEWVRDVVGPGVRIVDGVRTGVGILQGLVRGLV